MKYTIQEEIRKHFLDGAVQLLQEGRTFVFVLDNIDWDITVHDMRSENQNKVFMLYQQVLPLTVSLPTTYPMMAQREI